MFVDEGELSWRQWILNLLQIHSCIDSTGIGIDSGSGIGSSNTRWFKDFARYFKHYKQIYKKSALFSTVRGCDYKIPIYYLYTFKSKSLLHQ